MGEEDSTDWKKYLILGGAVVGLGVLGYYLFSGDRESERRAMLKEAEHIFGTNFVFLFSLIIKKDLFSWEPAFLLQIRIPPRSSSFLLTFIYLCLPTDQASGKKEEEDWDAAEQLFGDALALLKRHLTDKNDENIARVVQELSNCALNKMDVDKAEEYSREYVCLHRHSPRQHSGTKSPSLFTFPPTYRCLRIKEHIYGKESVEVCESLINLAGVLVALKAHKEALENAQRARRYPSLGLSFDELLYDYFFLRACMTRGQY